MSDDLATDPDDSTELADLRWHWDPAYAINCTDGIWNARSLHGTATLSAGTADELRRLIRSDYVVRRAAERGRDRGGQGTAAMGHGERALRRLRDDGLI